jgi:hypothetical protein
MNINRNSIFIGGLIGAGLGYLIADWYIETYIPEELELTLPDPIDRFNRRLEKTDQLSKTKPVDPEKAIRNYTEHFIKEDRPDLAALAAKYRGEEIELTSEEGIAAQDDSDLEEEYLDNDDVDPRIISIDEYAANQEFSHETLSYYTDDVLTDERDIPINRPEKFLGEEALVSFGEQSGDPDIVYVMNSEKKAMYEIVRLDRAYATKTSGRVKPRPQKVKVEGNEQ